MIRPDRGNVRVVFSEITHRNQASGASFDSLINTVKANGGQATNAVVSSLNTSVSNPEHGSLEIFSAPGTPFDARVWFGAVLNVRVPDAGRWLVTVRASGSIADHDHDQAVNFRLFEQPVIGVATVDTAHLVRVPTGGVFDSTIAITSDSSSVLQVMSLVQLHADNTPPHGFFSVSAWLWDDDLKLKEADRN